MAFSGKNAFAYPGVTPRSVPLTATAVVLPTGPVSPSVTALQMMSPFPGRLSAFP